MNNNNNNIISYNGNNNNNSDSTIINDDLDKDRKIIEKYLLLNRYFGFTITYDVNYSILDKYIIKNNKRTKNIIHNYYTNKIQLFVSWTYTMVAFVLFFYFLVIDDNTNTPYFTLIPIPVIIYTLLQYLFADIRILKAITFTTNFVIQNILLFMLLIMLCLLLNFAKGLVLGSILFLILYDNLIFDALPKEGVNSIGTLVAALFFLICIILLFQLNTFNYMNIYNVINIDVNINNVMITYSNKELVDSILFTLFVLVFKNFAAKMINTYYFKQHDCYSNSIYLKVKKRNNL